MLITKYVVIMSATPWLCTLTLYYIIKKVKDSLQPYTVWFIRIQYSKRDNIIFHTFIFIILLPIIIFLFGNVTSKQEFIIQTSWLLSLLTVSLCLDLHHYYILSN